MSRKQAPAPNLWSPLATPARCGHVGKRPVAVVAIEDVGAVVVEEEVADRRRCRNRPATTPRPNPVIADARPLGHVGEFTVAVVAVEGVRGPLRSRLSAQRSSVEKVDVDPAVAVVVEQGQTGGDRLHDVAPARTPIGVHESNTAVRRHIAKLNGSRRRGRGGFAGGSRRTAGNGTSQPPLANAMKQATSVAFRADRKRDHRPTPSPAVDVDDGIPDSGAQVSRLR